MSHDPRTGPEYLKSKLEEALAADERITAFDIQISLEDGAVRLRGEVSTEERRLAVSEVAAAVLPGIEIRNELTVLRLAVAAPPEPIRDQGPGS
jgi:osmotically-inducible protein OsmY